MKPHFIIPVLFFCFIRPGHGAAQTLNRFNTFSYNVNEGLLQTSINDVCFDSNNFLWLSFPNGIQKFDGTKFINVPVQPGLPDDKWVQFFRCRNNNFLVSHANGISIFEPLRNRFRPVSVNTPGRRPALFLAEINDRLYTYTTNGMVNTLDSRTLETLGSKQLTQSAAPESLLTLFDFSSNTQNNKIAYRYKDSVFLWDLVQQQTLYSGALPATAAGFFLHLEDDHTLLFYNSKTDIILEKYDFKTKQIVSVSANSQNNLRAFRSVQYDWNNRTLLSRWNRLYETDSSLQKVRAEYVDYQNKPIGGSASIARIVEDNFGNLYAVTINEGFKKIIRNNYPVKYYGTEDRQVNYIISVLPDKKNNRIIAGTYGNGLLVFDTLQQLIKHIKTLPGAARSFSPNAIVKNNKGDYILLLSGEKDAWILNKNLAAIRKQAVTAPANSTGTGYYSNYIFTGKTRTLLSAGYNIYSVNPASNAVAEHPVPGRELMGSVLFNGNIVMHSLDELLFIDTVSFQINKRLPFKNTGGVRCMIAAPGNCIYAGTNKGIFKLDAAGNELLHLTKENGLPDECIYSMAQDSKGLLWCSTNKGIFRLNKDNSIFLLKKEDGLQENEFNTNVVAAADDGELFFGGVNGISSFFPNEMSGFDEKINLLFTNIRINNNEAFTDTAVWNIKDIVLPYDKNLLSFDFAAMGGNTPAQYIYQYRMTGIDDRWIRNDGLQTVRYLLPPGKYDMEIYASRFFDKDAKPLRTIHIIIRPPFWKTWWFIAAMIAAFSSIMIFSINRYNRRKYRRKLHQKENEYKLQLERERISRDLHDNIGAYANAVLYNTELLQDPDGRHNKDRLMTDLKFASKDIITALRESVWALKKDSYTAQECILRIKNFIHPLNRYYPAIKFSTEENDVPQISMHSTYALNIVRIMQEAVTNAIKHSGARNIVFSNVFYNDEWTIAVTDDGAGFEPEHTEALQHGNGLSNIKKRAADTGSLLKIDSVPGRGTGVSITIKTKDIKGEN